MDDKTRDKCEKLLRLVKQGVGGEAENAERLLEKILAEHGMEISDIDDSQFRTFEATLKYNDPHDKHLWSQIVSMVLDDPNPKIYRYRNTRTLGIEVTAAEKAEIVVRYEILRAALKAERETLFNAFIIKHRLWAESTPSSDEPKEMTEETERALQMARGLKDLELTKRLCYSDKG